MSDKKLLRLAAKAAGICGHFSREDLHIPGWGSVPQCKKCKADYPAWDPLEDDGDALRLAVRLGLEIGVLLDMPLGAYSFAKLNSGASIIENHGGNPYSATRRAIVRAAAEIGKEKEA